MIHAQTGQIVPEVCIRHDCQKREACRLKTRFESCEHYTTCFDCAFKQTDEVSQEIFCSERLIDGQGHVDIKICEKFRRSR